MTELLILAHAPFLNVVVTGTSVTAPYTYTYVYNVQGGPLELLRQQSCRPSPILYTGAPGR